MKRFFLLIYLLNGITDFCSAQGFNAGLLAGISTTQVDGDRLSGFNKLGMVAGGFVNRNFSKKISVQFEIEYIQKGSRKPLSQYDSTNSTYILRLNYIEVPVLLRYEVKKNILLQGGASFGALLAVYEEWNGGVQEPNPPFSSMEFSMMGGVNYELSDNWSVDARYSYSLLPVRKFFPNYYYYFFDGGQYNRVITFTLHYQF